MERSSTAHGSIEPRHEVRLHYHLRGATLRGSGLPIDLPDLVDDLPDHSAALLDLCDTGSLATSSARAIRRALDDAARRDVVVVVAANEAEVRLPLIDAAAHRLTPLCRDVHSARDVLIKRIQARDGRDS